MRKKQKKPPGNGALLRKCRPFILPVAALLLVVGLIVAPLFQTERDTLVSGMTVAAPTDYHRRYADGRYFVWEYKGTGKNPGVLVLDADIKGHYAQNFPDAEAVLADCDWMREAELYINPHGVRMARGFAQDYGGAPERRYYVESAESVFLVSMIENDRYYSPADCEAAILEMADGIRPAGTSAAGK